jgi:hypothetical protein
MNKYKKISHEIAARIWCKPTCENKIFDHEIAQSFATILYDIFTHIDDIIEREMRNLNDIKDKNSPGHCMALGAFETAKNIQDFCINI